MGLTPQAVINRPMMQLKSKAALISSEVANWSLILPHLMSVLTQQVKVVCKVFLKDSRCSLFCLLFWGRAI